jgi:hypothetical protein
MTPTRLIVGFRSRLLDADRIEKGALGMDVLTLRPDGEGEALVLEIPPAVAVMLHGVEQWALGVLGQDITHLLVGYPAGDSASLEPARKDG